jgi:two-component system, LytTR family, sensor kinase
MKKSFIYLLHTGYWLLYGLLISTFVLLMAKGRLSWHELWTSLFLSPLALFCFLPGVLGFYSFYTILFDHFLIRKKHFAFAGFAVVFALAAGMITTVLLALPIAHWMGRTALKEQLLMSVFLAMLAAIHGIIGLVLKGFISWYADIKLKEELNNRNYETELALVKSQINPHFLFNTINNIDVLIEKDATKASLYLNKLSGLMRFMLYETKTDRIPLQKELDYIEEYIALQRIRTANSEYVQYTLQGEPGNRMIAPMLFIAYIENAFKHAAPRKEGHAVNITLCIGSDTILFRCENKYQRATSVNSGHNGLGNELLQRRLALLYPGKHTLDISDQEGIYKVNLTLSTHEN